MQYILNNYKYNNYLHINSSMEILEKDVKSTPYLKMKTRGLRKHMYNYRSCLFFYFKNDFKKN